MTLMEHACANLSGGHDFGAEVRVSPRVTLSNAAEIACIRMDDGRGNALGEAMLCELDAAFDAARDAAAVLLLGRARIFSGGLDLFEIAAFSKRAMIDFLDLLHQVRRKIYALRRPLVVAVSGSAIGAGASIACCGDMRLGVRNRGQFALPEVRLGVPLPSSALEIVTSTLGPANAARVLLFGASFDPDEALAMGMLHQLIDADELESVALAAAGTASQLSSAAVSIKDRLRREALRRMDATRAESHEAFAAAWVTPETRDRIEFTLRQLSRTK